jgi:subtilisin family serine protease
MQVMKRFAVLGAVSLTVAACQDATSPRPATSTPSAPNATRGGAAGDYIVVFRNDETDPVGGAGALVRAHGGSLRSVYRTAIKGFAVANLPDAAVEALQQNPRVAYVEPDAIMTIDGTQSPTPSWGLDRIDATGALNNSYTYPNGGEGVTVYIIDTGINATHSDFGPRVATGFDVVDGGLPADCHGHGTHVAGTVGGTAYGVAKAVTLVGVRVLSCAGSGPTSGVIDGVEWVMANARKPAVANMSLGGDPSTALDAAIANAVASGVTFAVAAGNSGANACNYSPARATSAITVGATTSGDARASYSNYGSCVDIMAPGSGITSAWIGSNTATRTISGTSMASPHVAGAAALVLANNSALSPQQVRDALFNGATNNALAPLPAGTPNKLLYVGFITGGNPTPGFTASFTKSCAGLSCTFTSTTVGATSLSWSFPNGNTASGEQVTYKFDARGNYTVTLTASNGSTSDTETVAVACNPKKCQ